MHLRRDIASHRQAVSAFAAFWFVLLVITALTWQGGIPGWLFSIHALLLPALAGVATSGFRLNSGIAGIMVSEIDLLIVSVVPMASLSLLPNPPMPAEPLFTGWAMVVEVLEFVVLMAIPGYLLGLIGGALGRRFWGKRAA